MALQLGDNAFPDFTQDSQQGPINPTTTPRRAGSVLCLRTPPNYNPVCHHRGAGRSLALRPEWEKRNVKPSHWSVGSAESPRAGSATSTETQRQTSVRLPDPGLMPINRERAVPGDHPKALDNLGKNLVLRSVFNPSIRTRMRLPDHYPASTGANLMRCCGESIPSSSRTTHRCTPVNCKDGKTAVVVPFDSKTTIPGEIPLRESRRSSPTCATHNPTQSLEAPFGKVRLAWTLSPCAGIGQVQKMTPSPLPTLDDQLVAMARGSPSHRTSLR